MINVLYVDDEKFNLLVFKHSVSKNVNVLTALSADEGLELLDKNKGIQAVVSDMRMPFINGVDFIRMAKEKYPTINYYILTGFDINEEIDQALNDKLIIKYFNKPFDISKIEEEIRANLETM